jgi:sulfoxide reductase catalytic subunit YedY
MLILRPDRVPPSEITPRHLFERRREFLRLSAGAALAGILPAAQAGLGPGRASVYSTSEELTPLKHVTGYNNFTEFGFNKDDPARTAHTLVTSPWTLSIEGLVRKPKTLGIEDILKLAPLEERIYRLRCVEGWSMVIPWVGYSLAALLKQVEPLGSARYVSNSSPKPCNRAPCPAGGRGGLDWPYTEGLRLDEAMHPADPAGPGALRRRAAQPERRPGALGGAMEVWLQERQVHRQDPPGTEQHAGHRVVKPNA